MKVRLHDLPIAPTAAFAGWRCQQGSTKNGIVLTVGVEEEIFEEGVLAPNTADLTTSYKVSKNDVIARTLLAPVLNPVAELAGFSGLASGRTQTEHSYVHGTRSRTTEMPPHEPHTSLALPSRLSPGLEDPFTATGNNRFNIYGDTRQTWMTKIDPIASWNAIAISESDSRSPHCLNRTIRSSSESLIPRSVRYLAKPTFQTFDVVNNSSDDARRNLASPVSAMRSGKAISNPASWPQPKQLCRDLAVIASNADIARMATPGNRQSLASVQLKVILPSESRSQKAVRDLISAGNVQKLSGQGVSPLRRKATSIVMGRWADRVDSTVSDLRALPRIGDERSGTLIRQLGSLSQAGLQLAERVPSRDQQIQWLRAAHASSRRANVWGPIWQLARDGESGAYSKTIASTASTNGSEKERHYLSLVRLDADGLETEASTNTPEIPALVSTLRHELDATGDEMGWSKFLLLDEIESADRSDDAEVRALVAQRFLSRLQHHLLTPDHLQWLSRDNVLELAEALQAWTIRPIDYTELLGDLERGETDAIDLAAIKVGEAFQSLRFSNDRSAAKVAKAIDVNYRNANVRTAISVDLIDRLLPAVPTKTQQVRTQVLGNEVRGTSTVDSKLGISLSPSVDSWKLNIRTSGDVATQSSTGQSGVTVSTNGLSHFNATTPLVIRPGSYDIGKTHVDVNGTQQLRGIRSRYDGWPLVGSLVRGIAEGRFEKARPIADRISSEKIRDNVQQELQTQLAVQTGKGSKKLDEFVFGPLGRLNLEPKVIDMRTTDQRLIARYRLAGDWQLASNTPRPRAWNDSWMSLQVHQSAMNNTLEQLLPTGKSKTFEEFYHETLMLFGQEVQPLPEDIPADAMIEFAATRPITVEMKNGKLMLTLRVVSLSQAGRNKLRRFIVRAGYRPEIDGLSAKLVRDGHLSISGPGMSMRQRFPIRALFNKVLSETRSIPLTLPRLIEHPATQDLAISQLEIRDGWLALAISPASEKRVAVGMRSYSPSKAVTR